MRLLFSVLLLLCVQSSVLAMGIPDLKAENPIQLISYTSQNAKITGTIMNTDISERNKIIFLNFGENYNTSFTAMIYQEAIPDFVSAGIVDPVEFFKNKTVTLKGIIRLSDGKPEMIINSPGQIKVLDEKQ